MIDPQVLAEARRLLAALELISHGTTMSFTPAPARSARARPVPPGGVMREDDNAPSEFYLHANRSHLYFRPLVRDAATTACLETLIDEMRKAIEAWQHTPKPPKDSIAWREQVGLAVGDVKDIAEEWQISPSRVYQLRRQYRQEAA